MRRQTAIAAVLEADFPSPRVQANVERIVEPDDQARICQKNCWHFLLEWLNLKKNILEFAVRRHGGQMQSINETHIAAAKLFNKYFLFFISKKNNRNI